MLTVFAALIPVFLLIVLGYGLRRTFLKHDMMWTGLEQLIYYVLFPALLIDSLARAERLQPELNCFITLCGDQAMADAREAERAFRALCFYASGGQRYG